MPLFTVTDGALRPVPQVRPGPELYEFEIQELIWGNVEAFYGADLLPIGRRKHLHLESNSHTLCKFCRRQVFTLHGQSEQPVGVVRTIEVKRGKMTSE